MNVIIIPYIIPLVVDNDGGHNNDGVRDSSNYDISDTLTFVNVMSTCMNANDWLHDGNNNER